MSFPNVPNVPAGWNDPESSLFQRGSGSNSRSNTPDLNSLNISQVTKQLQDLLTYCLQQVSADNTMMVRMLNDAEKKITPFLQSADKSSLNSQSLSLLFEFINSVNQKDYLKAQKVVADLMKSSFSSDSSSNQYVLGLKRLLEVHRNMHADQPLQQMIH